MIRGLIIGYGRAGKRHGKMLDELGVEWMTVDPFLGDRFPEFLGVRFFSKGVQLQDVLDKKSPWNGWFDFAVIATPPDLHLAQIRQCLDAGLPVLCEKPLCGLGQLAEAEALLEHPNAGKVMVAYNWRYHPKIRELKERKLSSIGMFCAQHRKLPEWGLLLDHCSHDLDIMSFILGTVEVLSAKFYQEEKWQRWEILLDKGNFFEMVGSSPSSAREAKIYIPKPIVIDPDATEWSMTFSSTKDEYDGEIIDLDPDPAMYTAMWAAFLGGRYEPGLEEAIETQRLLERCEELAR